MKKSFFCSSRDGDAWAQQQFKANEMADALDTSTWTLNARCRGVALAIPVLPSDPARVLLEFVADAFEGVDAAFSKAVFKGKMLPPDQALTEIAGLKDGSKVMVIASSVAEVAAVLLCGAAMTLLFQRCQRSSSTTANKQEQDQDIRVDNPIQATYSIEVN